MKTLHSNTYKYLGVKDGMHVFTKFLEDSDPEIIYLFRARYVLPDGNVVYYDPIIDKRKQQLASRLGAYYNGITKEGLIFSIPIPEVTKYKH